jgi:AcrR family transcriptional regulator
MVRIVKDADVRRDELLDTALALFLECGYERTSVEHITSTVGVAKGTFYHYFATKDALLEQLVDRYSDRLFEEIGDALSAVSGGAVERFKVLMVSSSTAKLGRPHETLLITESLYSENNREMLERMRDGWIDRLRPIIAKIVEQGCSEGSFDVPDVDGFTDICLSLWLDYGIRIGRHFFEVRGDKLRMAEVYSALDTLVIAVERILHAKPGSLAIDATPVYDVIADL